MSDCIILEIYKDIPSHVSPYIIDTKKVAEMDITDMSTAELDKIFKIQEVLGRRWSIRRIRGDMNEPDPLIQKLIEAGAILDSQPIATGWRYVFNPIDEKLERVFVPESINNKGGDMKTTPVTIELPKCAICGETTVYDGPIPGSFKFDIYTCPNKCEGASSRVVERQEEEEI